MYFIGLALCRHDGSKKNYLFRTPECAALEAGDRVVVETKNGQQLATVVSTVAAINPEDEDFELILELAGVESVDNLKRVLQKCVYKDLVYREDK